MQIHTLHSQRGLTLGEMLIYLAALAAVGAYLASVGGGIFGATRIEQAHQELHAAITAAQTYRSIQGSYDDIDVEELVDNGYNLAGFTNGTGENVYGKDLVIAPTTGDADAEFDYGTESSKACNQLKSRIDQLDGIAVAAACAATTHLLEFTIN